MISAGLNPDVIGKSPTTVTYKPKVVLLNTPAPHYFRVIDAAFGRCTIYVIRGTNMIGWGR